MKKFLYTSALALLLFQPMTANSGTLNKETALRRALQNNPSYKASLSNIDAAAGSRLQASLSPNPNATFEVENFAGENEQKDLDGAELTLGIEQTIEIGGKRTNRTNIADFDFKISQQQAKARGLRLLAETEYAFIRLAVAQERMALADKRLSLADKTHEIVKKLVVAAKAADIQHTKADIEEAAAKVEKRKAVKELVTAKNDLARLLGNKQSYNLRVDANLKTLPYLVRQKVLMDALTNAPQSRMQEFARMKAQSSLNLAHSESIPDPTFSLGVRHFNESDSTALMAGISFPIPVFNRNQGEIQKARANVIKADAESYAAVLALRQSALQAWESLASSLEETRRYQDQIIPSAKKAYKQADDGYNRGAFGFLYFLDAQRTLYGVQEAWLKSLLEVYKAKAQTDFLMGTHNSLIENFSQKTTGKK